MADREQVCGGLVFSSPANDSLLSAPRGSAARRSEQGEQAVKCQPRGSRCKCHQRFKGQFKALQRNKALRLFSSIRCVFPPPRTTHPSLHQDALLDEALSGLQQMGWGGSFSISIFKLSSNHDIFHQYIHIYDITDSSSI
jgi:hypothetical protein